MTRPYLRGKRKLKLADQPDKTARHRIVFLILCDCPFGTRGQIIRSFLSPERYGAALNAQRHGVLLIFKQQTVV